MPATVVENVKRLLATKHEQDVFQASVNITGAVAGVNCGDERVSVYELRAAMLNLVKDGKISTKDLEKDIEQVVRKMLAMV